MSRADDPYDNAWAESFWTGPPSGRLKAELNMPKGGYESLEKSKLFLFEYIDGYDNTRRLHCAGSPVLFNYRNPAAFETEYYWQLDEN
jgi:putative transposase